MKKCSAALYVEYFCRIYTDRTFLADNEVGSAALSRAKKFTTDQSGSRAVELVLGFQMVGWRSVQLFILNNGTHSGWMYTTEIFLCWQRGRISSAERHKEIHRRLI